MGNRDLAEGGAAQPGHRRSPGEGKGTVQVREAWKGAGEDGKGEVKKSHASETPPRSPGNPQEMKRRGKQVAPGATGNPASDLQKRTGHWDGTERRLGREATRNENTAWFSKHFCIKTKIF